MTVLTKRAIEVFAPTTAAGQLRGADMAETMVWGTEVERGQEGAAAGRVDQATWTGLAAIAGSRPGQPAIVYGPDAGTHTDPVTGATVTNIGQYLWSVTPAGWRRIGNLDRALVYALNTGTGSANAVQATSEVQFSQSAYSALITVNFVATNTGAMTLSINGETPRALVTNTGAAITSGYVKAGMAALVQIDSGGKYRLFSYGDAAAVQAAAEAAQAAAEAARDAAQAAASSIVPNMFATKAAAQAYNPVVSPDFLQLAGLTTSGDGGAALYKKVAVQPSHLGKLQIANGTWYEIAESEIDPLQMPGADDTARFTAALAFANKIVLNPNRDYAITSTLTVSRAVYIDGRGAKVTAQSGFVGDNLFNFTVGGFTLANMRLDGRYLPLRTTDFIGTDFIGFTLKMNGTSGAPFNDIVLKDLVIVAGDTASLAADYCHNMTVQNVTCDGTYTNATKFTEALLFLNHCNDGQYRGLRFKAIRHKGVSFQNCSRFNAIDLQARTVCADEAAIFASGSSYFNIDQINVLGGFGVKIDTGQYGELSNIVVHGNGVGWGGVYLQGCVEVFARHGEIRGFTRFGAAWSGHATKAAISMDCGFDDLVIHGSATKGDTSAGYYIGSDVTYGSYGTQIKGGLVRSVDIGILSYDAGTMVVDNTKLTDVRFEDLKSYIWNGPALSLNFSRNFIEASPTLDDGLRVWSDGTGGKLVVDNNEATTLGTAANFLNLIGSAGTPLHYDEVSFSGNRGSSGNRPLNVDMQASGTRVKSIVVGNNQWHDSNATDALKFNSASDTNMQVLVVGNSLLSSSLTKKDINFVQNAASGKFNGIVANNLAGVINTPNNV